jgi:SAM-dependent methyltransferase
VDRYRESLRLVADRPGLRAWAADMVDLPWSDPAFSERMLLEHLSQEHDLASRRLVVIDAQVGKLLDWLDCGASDSTRHRLLDLTCGPGLYAQFFARAGCQVTGVDISPASIRVAREITAGLRCEFIESDVAVMELPEGGFDAAIYLYGQAEVPKPDVLPEILRRIRSALRPGAPLALEIRIAARVPRTTGAGWHTGVDGLFGPGSQLVLSERGWDPESRATVERHHVIDVETGELTVLGGTERAFEDEEIAELLRKAGFPTVEFHPGWGGLDFERSADWQVVIGR